jgi:hypothetical protein
MHKFIKSKYVINYICRLVVRLSHRPLCRYGLPGQNAAAFSQKSLTFRRTYNFHILGGRGRQTGDLQEAGSKQSGRREHLKLPGVILHVVLLSGLLLDPKDGGRFVAPRNRIFSNCIAFHRRRSYSLYLKDLFLHCLALFAPTCTASQAVLSLLSIWVAF